MTYTTRDDKNAFFNAAKPWTIKAVEEYARSARVLDDGTLFNNYTFNLKNYTVLATELENCYEELESLKDDEETKDIFWFFCYYRCQQKLLFYGSDEEDDREEGYSKPDKLDLHEKLAAKIRQYFEPCDVISLPKLPDQNTPPPQWPINSDSAYIIVDGKLFYVIKGAVQVTVKQLSISPQKLRNFNEAVKPKNEARVLSRKELHYIRAKIDIENETESSLRQFYKAFRHDVVGIITIPTKVSSIKNILNLLNLWRVYWVFCRLTMTVGLNYFRQAHLIEKFEKLMGKKFDEADFIRKMEVPNIVFNVLSVGLFAGLFLLNAALLIKHVCFPRGAEKNSKWPERLSFEIYKRNSAFLNYGVWAPVNLLTNYPRIIDISAPVANWLIAGFLGFDFAMVLWQRFWAQREHHRMRNNYDLELKEYKKRQAQLAAEIAQLHSRMDLDADERIKLLAAKKEQQELLDQQIAFNIKESKRELLKWRAKNLTFWFNAIAAALFATGFSAALIFAAPVVAVVAYATCMVAVAMYLSGNAYGNVKEKSLRFFAANKEYENAKKENQGPSLWHIKFRNNALRDYQAARKEFWLTMARNVIIPTLMIALLAACWQAAVAFAVLYVGYKLYQHYHKPNNAPKEVGAVVPALPVVGANEPRLADYRAVDEEVHADVAALIYPT